MFDFEICAAAGRRALPALLDVGAPSDAAAAHALDRDDVHWPSVTHPGAIVWPVVLAASAEADASGDEAVRAAAVGYELTARLAAALGAEHRRYWHATATAGTVGAAVAAALALRLARAKTATAAGHAISVAGGSAQSLFERSGTRIFHRAHAAATALAAASAARRGLRATVFGLESERGLFAATAPESDPERVLEGRPRWAIGELGLRFHAASGFAHAALEAALELAPVARGSVTRVAIEAPAPAIALAGIAKPTTREEGWWSLPYSVAVGLVGGTPSALETDRLLDVGDLLAVTELSPRTPRAPEDLAATVTVEHAGGAPRSATCAAPLGHPDRPLDDADLLAKARALGVFGDAAAAALLALTRRFAELPVRRYLADRPREES